MLVLRFSIVPLAVILITPMIYWFVKKRNLKKESKMRNDEFVLMNSPVFCGIILACEIIYATILILLNVFDKISFIQDVICIAFLIMFAVFFIVIIKEKVIVKGDVIKVIPSFGKARELSFFDINYINVTATSRGLVSYKVYKDKCKLFSFSNVYIGANLFINRAKKYNIKFEEE